MDVPDTLEFLLGRWAVVRVITDHRAGLEGRFEGSAEVREDLPPRLRGGDRSGDASAARQERWAAYAEVGRLHLGHHDGVARRRLRLRRRPDASVLVELADGRPFVRCDLRDGRWTARHDCGADSYQVGFAALSSEMFEERWRVRGPTKHYDARTVFLREGRADLSARPDAAPPGRMGGC